MGRKRKLRASPSQQHQLQQQIDSKRDPKRVALSTSNTSELSMQGQNYGNGHFFCKPVILYTRTRSRVTPVANNVPNQYTSTPVGGPVTGSPPLMNNDMFTQIMNRVDCMDKRLSQLDSIQSSLSNLTVKMQSVETRISDVEKKSE